MSEGNGTLLPHGETSREEILGDWRQTLREDLKLLRAAVKQRWNVPGETKALAVARLDAMLRNERILNSPRALTTISKTLSMFDGNDLKALEILDKIHRLETGGATENVQQQVRVIIERDDA